MTNLTYEQQLLQHVAQHNTDAFVAMVNQWMDERANPMTSVGHDVDQFLELLMDEQKEHRSKVEYDDLFLALSAWMKQATLEQRTAMLFNTEHMVGLSILGKTDDVALLQSVPDYSIFIPNDTHNCINFSFVSNLLTATEDASASLQYIFSSPAFIEIVKHGNTCTLAGRSVSVEKESLDSFLWRVFKPVRSSPEATKIAGVVLNSILDHISAPVIESLMDVFTSYSRTPLLCDDFFSDHRFSNWDKQEQFFIDYLQKTSTTFPASMNTYFPSLAGVAACNCAHTMVEASALNTPLSQVQQSLAHVCGNRDDAHWVIQQTILKLDSVSQPSMTVFPDFEIGTLLDSLSDTQLQQWRQEGWEHDEKYSINKYPQFVKMTLLDHIDVTTTTKRRVL